MGADARDTAPPVAWTSVTVGNEGSGGTGTRGGAGRTSGEGSARTHGPGAGPGAGAGGGGGAGAGAGAGAGTAGGRAVLRVTRGVSIPLDELTWRFTTSGGPGGQHANKTSSRAEVRFDVASSPSLGPRQRARLLERMGPVVRAASSDERSQARNREEALRRLAARLADGLHTEPRRIPTAPSAGARARRVEDKRRRSVRKRERATRPDLDD